MNAIETITLLHHVQEWLVWLTVPAATGFPIWYQWRIHWRHSPVGQHIMAYSSVVALLYFTALLQYFHMSLLALTWISMILTLLMGIVVWWRVLIFVWIYRHSRREKYQPQEERNDVPMDT